MWTAPIFARRRAAYAAGMKTAATIIAAALLAAGCSTAPVLWHKPGGTNEALRMDVAQCSTLQLPTPRATAGMQAMVDALNEEALYLNCMAGKGWVQVRR